MPKIWRNVTVTKVTAQVQSFFINGRSSGAEVAQGRHVLRDDHARDELAEAGAHVKRAADGVAEGEARRRAFLLQRLAELQEAVHVLREGVEAGGLHMAHPVHHRRAGATERQADPLVAALAVGFGAGLITGVVLGLVMRSR